MTSEAATLEQWVKKYIPLLWLFLDIQKAADCQCREILITANFSASRNSQSWEECGPYLTSAIWNLHECIWGESSTLSSWLFRKELWEMKFQLSSLSSSGRGWLLNEPMNSTEHQCPSKNLQKYPILRQRGCLMKLDCSGDGVILRTVNVYHADDPLTPVTLC